jgi:beta-glucanase (GH16 family)
MQVQPYNHNLPPDWKLSYDARPADLLTWSKQYPFGNTATFNQEIETYLPANVYVSNGELILEGRNTGGGNAGVSGGKYTSGMIASYNTLGFLYGYVEGMIKMPAGYGVWPAFWMLYQTYPASNEIDIVEIFENPLSLNNGVHFPNGSGGTGSDGGATTLTTDMSAGYHAYAVEWEPTFVQFYFDGQPIRRITTSGEIPSQLMYILANVAISGVAVGDHIPADAQFPLQMHIKYIRVWQRQGTQYQLSRIAAPVYANYMTAVRLDGAIASYALNEASGSVAVDSIGGANGTIIGTVQYNQSALTGDQSASMGFNGSTTYVALPNSINPTGLFAFAVEIWFEYPTTPAINNGRIVSNGHTDSTNTGFQMMLNSAAGGLVSLATANKTSNLYFSTNITAGTPHHYAMSYDGAHVYAYLDGVQVGTDTLTGAIVSSGLPINIGRGSWNADYWTGLGAHCSFYYNSLTAAQVQAHYNAGLAALTGPATLSLSESQPLVVTATEKAVS